LLERIVNDTAGALDYTAVVLARGPAVVNKENLSDNDAADLAPLAVLLIQARDEALLPS